MHHWVALLRGMNLGRRRVKNDELCTIAEGLGFEEVTAFLASGNLVFQAGRRGAAGITKDLEAGLERALGYPVTVVLRRGTEIREIAATTPLEDAPATFAGKLQVMLAARLPSASAARAVEALATPHDLLSMRGRELFWLPRAGVLDSTMDIKAIEALLAPVTTRTHRTMERLAARIALTS